MEAIYARTLNRPDSHLTLPKVMWACENRPEIVRSAASIVQSNDYLTGRLTGISGVTDPSNASLTGGFDPIRREWVVDLWDAAGIERRLLPQVRPSISVLGGVAPAAARAIGVAPGIPVVVGGGDGACASAGSGVPTSEAYNYLGGTSWMGLVTDSPVTDSRLSSYCSLDERLTSFGTVQAAGSSIEWISRIIGSGAVDLAALDRAAAAVPPGSRRLMFLPYLQGERAPVWDDTARGVFFGLATHHGKAELYRAVLEGVSFALGSIVAVFEENGRSLESLRLLGGGASSKFWVSLLAAVLGRPLQVVGDLSSATSLGAAMAAGVGIGCWPSIADAAKLVAISHTVQPDSDMARNYAPLAEYFTTLYPAFAERFQALVAIPVPATYPRLKPTPKREGDSTPAPGALVEGT
jgi:xylulokinase